MTNPVSQAPPTRLRRIGVIGAAGQLGRCLVRCIESAEDFELGFAATRAQVDLRSNEEIAAFVAGHCTDGIDVVVNTAAHTGVDLCESERELAYQVNGLAPAEWARHLSAAGVGHVHLSTDYVFAGDGSIPYRETDETDPRTVYGTTKRAGELAVLGTDPSALVVRTSWIFGPGRNFVVTILDQAHRRRSGEIDGPLRVVDDQHGSPTSAADLAEALLLLIRLSSPEAGLPSGLLHLRNAGETSWYGFAREILERAGYDDIDIEPVSTRAFPTAALRPAYSVLDCQRAAGLGIEMRPWTEALASYLEGPDRPIELLTGMSSSSPSPSTGSSEVSR